MRIMRGNDASSGAGRLLLHVEAIQVHGPQHLSRQGTTLGDTHHTLQYFHQARVNVECGCSRLERC